MVDFNNTTTKHLEDKTMNKEFVPYELAVKLKALGFDEPCLASYETAFGKGIDFELGYIIDGPKNYVLAHEFESICNAAKQLNISKSGIIRCCKGKQKKCGNFIFKYKEYENI